LKEGKMNWPKIEVWRMSCGRPEQLEASHPTLLKNLQYSGELEYHLIESVRYKEASEECIAWGKNHDYKVHVINPAKGQGYAVWYYLNEVADCKYGLKWEDDFQAEKVIPLDDCIRVMENYNHINQICFNKRETMKAKWCSLQDGTRYEWEKEQRVLGWTELIGGIEAKFLIPLVCKEKWWFGASLWRIDFIKPIFRWWEVNTHNTFNDEVIIPMIRKEAGKYDYTASDMEKSVGCYIYGKTGDERMAWHAGGGVSWWAGEMQEKLKAEGKEIIGV